MAEKRQTAGKRKAGRAKRTTGRIQVRRDTAEYRAAGEAQSSQVREEIDAALADARRVREEIEARMDSLWQNRTAPSAAATGRASRKA